jgi:nicotinamidase-related amidase
MTDATRFDLQRKDAVVVLIDLQERLLVAMPEKERLVANTRVLLEGAKLLDVPILWTEQYPKGLGPTEESVRALLDPKDRAEKIVFSAWREPEFSTKLRATDRRSVILPGIESHVCVMQTALDLLYAGYRVFVPADCVASRTDENKRVGLSTMRQAGAALTSVEAAVFQMFERAGGDAFKAFQKKIK